MNIFKHLSLSTTTLLGVVGALTGNPSIQASSYIPNIIEEYVRQSSSVNFDKKLQNDWFTAINQASMETVNRLENQSKNMKRLFEISLPRIERIHETAYSFHNFSDELTLAIEKEQYEIDWITPQDIKNINDTFLNNLSIAIAQTETLSHYFGLQNIRILENRVDQVEKILQQTLSIEFKNNCILKDDLALYSNRYEEPLFFHKYVDDCQKICLKDIFTTPLCDIMDPRHKTPIRAANNIENCLKYFFHQRPKDSSEFF